MSTLLLLLVLCHVVIVSGFHRLPTISTITTNTATTIRIRSATLQFSKLSGVTPGIGDEGCALPSPSGVNTLPIPIQTTVFFTIYAGLFSIAYAIIKSYEQLLTTNEFLQSQAGTFPINGILFFIAGVLHFTVKDEFVNMMPAKGSWGIWYIPGSKEFHVIWTGIVEIVFGFLLFGSYLANNFHSTIFTDLFGANVLEYSALALLILFVLVTPANIYMFTHGAKLPMNGPPVR